MSTVPTDPARTDAPEQPKRRRSFLLVLLAIVCVIAAVVITRKSILAKRQAELTKIVRDAGGSVQYDYNGKAAGEPSGIEWMRNLLGDEYFVTVNTVRLSGDHITDEKIAALVPDLKKIGTLQAVEIESSKVTNESVGPLSQMSGMKLQSLCIYNSKMDTHALQELTKKFPSKTRIAVAKRNRF